MHYALTSRPIADRRLSSSIVTHATVCCTPPHDRSREIADDNCQTGQLMDGIGISAPVLERYDCKPTSHVTALPSCLERRPRIAFDLEHVPGAEHHCLSNTNIRAPYRHMPLLDCVASRCKSLFPGCCRAAYAMARNVSPLTTLVLGSCRYRLWQW